MNPYRTPDPVPPPPFVEPEPEYGSFSVVALCELGTYWARFFKELEDLP